MQFLWRTFLKNSQKINKIHAHINLQNYKPSTNKQPITSTDGLSTFVMVYINQTMKAIRKTNEQVNHFYHVPIDYETGWKNEIKSRVNPCPAPFTNLTAEGCVPGLCHISCKPICYSFSKCISSNQRHIVFPLGHSWYFVLTHISLAFFVRHRQTV